MVPSFIVTTIRYILSGLLIQLGLVVGLIRSLTPACLIQKDVEGDIVLVTGGGSGLGRCLALEYAKLGSRLVLWDINQAGLSESKSLIEQEYKKRSSGGVKSRCLTYVVDVSDKNMVQQFAKTVHLDINKDRSASEPERHVSVLVNNAGIFYGQLLHELSDNQIERIFKINVLAHYWTIRAFLPKMIELGRGHIVEIASMAGIAGLYKQVDYCATKHAVVGIEEALSLELDYMGVADEIKTTVVCPFFFSSNLFVGYQDSLMTAEFVAKEAVKAMRCNQSRVMLPKLFAYLILISKSILPRDYHIKVIRLMGFAEKTQDLKGTPPPV